MKIGLLVIGADPQGTANFFRVEIFKDNLEERGHRVAIHFGLPEQETCDYYFLFGPTESQLPREIEKRTIHMTLSNGTIGDVAQSNRFLALCLTRHHQVSNPIIHGFEAILQKAHIEYIPARYGEYYWSDGKEDQTLVDLLLKYLSAASELDMDL